MRLGLLLHESFNFRRYFRDIPSGEFALGPRLRQSLSGRFQHSEPRLIGVACGLGLFQILVQFSTIALRREEGKYQVRFPLSAQLQESRQIENLDVIDRGQVFGFPLSLPVHLHVLGNGILRPLPAAPEHLIPGLDFYPEFVSAGVRRQDLAILF